MSTRSNESSARIDFLDYARIIAFISVLIGHLFNEDLARIAADSGIHAFFRQLSEIAYRICAFGGMGVVIFFITSGYIISHVIKNETTIDFIIRRIFRIYPLFIFATICEMALATTTGNASFPPLDEIIPRLLLLGDFSGVAYGLGGVEWTLRVELVFYVFMVMLKATGVLRLEKLLPAFVFLVSLVVFSLPPFPSSFGWTDGYFNLFFPFLIVGILFYQFENSNLKGLTFHVFSITIFLISLLKIQSLQPRLNGSNFELFAMLTFYVLWYFRSRIRGHFLSRTLSEMTYAVYLFHLWSWSYLGLFVEKYGLPYIPNRLQRLILLFAFCFLAAKTVEKYGIKLGRLICQRRTARGL